MDERVIDWGQFYGSNQTVIDPIALVATLAGCAALLFMDQRRAILPLLLVSCFIPVAQRIVIGGLDWNMMRLAILFGWMRVFLRREYVGLHWHPLDTYFVAWLVVGSALQILREGNMGSVIWRAGFCFEAAGTYFLFRCLLRSPSVFLGSVRYFAWIVIPLAAAMSLEYATSRNLFAVFGGVPEVTMEREGRLRCQGAFPHPILAGDFGGGLFPFLFGAYLSRLISRPLAAAGAAGAAAIVFLSGSSGPILAMLGGMAGWALWGLRWRMWIPRWAMVGAAFMLQLVMNHPIWFIFAVVGVIGGSTGWHRYALIDAFIRNWSEWAFFGVDSTGHWGWGMNDVTNHFVAEGVRSGLVAFALFLSLFVLAFKTVGREMRKLALRKDTRLPRRAWMFVLWGLGASLFAHAMAMTAVTYSDQLVVMFYMLLAMIASWTRAFAPAPVHSEARVPVGIPARA